VVVVVVVVVGATVVVGAVLAVVEVGSVVVVVVVVTVVVVGVVEVVGGSVVVVVVVGVGPARQTLTGAVAMLDGVVLLPGIVVAGTAGTVVGVVVGVVESALVLAAAATPESNIAALSAPITKIAAKRETPPVARRDGRASRTRREAAQRLGMQGRSTGARSAADHRSWCSEAGGALPRCLPLRRGTR
jgi:hypothetical protein